ncbi:MAG: hypothetical protein AB8B53_15165 [Flavobacteriales bacterium]
MEEKFTLIHTFLEASEVHIYRIVLDQNKIPYFLKDQFTNQVLTHSPFIGGTKLLVNSDYLTEAIEILEAQGLALDFTEVRKPSWLEKFVYEKIVSRLPTDKSGNPKTFFQVMKIPLLILAIITSVLVYKEYEGTSDLKESLIRLCENGELCVIKMKFNNEPLNIRSQDVYISLDCREKIVFLEDGTLILPGIGTNRTSGHWKINESNRIVIVSDNLKNIYSGEYSIKKTKEHIRLSSISTVIYLEYSKNFSLRSF